MYRFEKVFEEYRTLDPDDEKYLYQVTKIIYDYYLTPKEKTYYKCLQLYYSSKKQRELSILLNVDQPNLSAKFSKLRRKLRTIAQFLLSADHTDILKLQTGKNKLNLKLTPRQFEVLMYLLAGNRAYHISKQLQVSPVAIHQTIAYLKRKLSINDLPLSFLDNLGTI